LHIAESLRITFIEVILRLTDFAEQERSRAKERQDLLIGELNHLVRNILSLIRGLISQSRASARSLDGFAALVDGRIQALARAHDQVTATDWGPGSLKELISLEIGAFLGIEADRIRLIGADVLVEPQAFVTLALVIHELVTNATKYGALSDKVGLIEVSWELDEKKRLVIFWRETGGPVVKPPTRRGFGTTLIERSIPFELKGETEIRYELTGVEARFVIPATIVRLAPRSSSVSKIEEKAEEKSIGSRCDVRFWGSVLVVEDNMIIALDAEEMLLELGADRVDLASSVRDALRLIENTNPRFALIDVDLGSETTLSLAARLITLEVPFAVATGYGESLQIPQKLSHMPIVNKPYTIESLRAVLTFCAAPRISELLATNGSRLEFVFGRAGL